MTRRKPSSTLECANHARFPGWNCTYLRSDHLFRILLFIWRGENVFAILVVCQILFEVLVIEIQEDLAPFSAWFCEQPFLYTNGWLLLFHALMGTCGCGRDSRRGPEVQSTKRQRKRNSSLPNWLLQSWAPKSLLSICLLLWVCPREA